MIITIDGPSGTGKTTVARNVADRLGFVYFDTGAMYRAFTWFALESKMDMEDVASVERCLNAFDFRVVEAGKKKRYYVGKRDVTDEIRGQHVTKMTSPISALRQVRSHLLEVQYHFAQKQNAVFEGRDLGTVVFPKAEVKIFLTADPEVRAERRLQEILAKNPDQVKGLTREQILADIKRRDEQDSTREVAPLRCPPDASTIDTTHLSIDQVVDRIVHYCTQQFPHLTVRMKPAWARKLPMSFLYRSVLFFAWCYFKVLYRHKVYGRENFYEGAAIIAANHSSFYDPPILAISWPEEVHFLAREGLFKNPLFGGFIRKLNAHPVSGDASDIGVFKLVCSLLAQGKKIILFPEGKRGDNEDLDALKQGIAMLVSRSKSAVVPAYIFGTFSIWSRFRKLPKFWGKTVCVYGSPILWSEFAHLEKKEAQKALTEKLAKSINDLRTWYERGAKGTPP